MDKLSKFLSKLNVEDRSVIEQILTAIYTGDWKDLDHKKLKGFDGVHRARKGKMRIVFRLIATSPIEIKLLSIGRRNDNTYNLY